MKTDATFIGVVRRVVGASVHVSLSDDLPSTSPIVDGRIYRIGQIGSFVRIPLGFLNLYGIVSMVGSVAIKADESQAIEVSAEKTLEIKLVGEAYRTSRFQRGLSMYPTVDDEVHVVTEDDLAKIYAPFGSSPVSIGRHSASENLDATLDLDKLVTRHCAVVGSTGSGKSNTVAAILKSITGGTFPKAQAIVIDPHGEYGAAFAGISKVMSIGGQVPFFLPYWCLSFDELAWFLVDRRSSSETVQDGHLRDKLFEMRRGSVATVQPGAGQAPLTADEITVDSPLPFNVRQLWYHFDRLERTTYRDAARTIEALISEGDPATLTSAAFSPAAMGAAAPFKPQPPPVMGSYVSKISQRLKDRRFDFLLSPGRFDGTTKDISDLIAEWIDHEHPITVFDLAGVPPEIMDLVVGLLSRTIFEVMFWGRNLPGMGRQRPVLLVFEEAHRYLPSGEGYFIQGYARRSVQRVLKEGRKYGIGAVLVSQRPSELDETILSQCGTFIALRLSNGQDQARVRSAFPDELSGLTDLLPALRTGEAVISGEATQIPSRVRIHLVEPRPDSGDPSVSKLWASEAEETREYQQAVTNWRRQRVS